MGKMFDMYTKDLEGWLGGLLVDLNNIFEGASEVDKRIQDSKASDAFKEVSSGLLVNISYIFKEVDAKLDELDSLNKILETKAMDLEKQLLMERLEVNKLRTKLSSMRQLDVNNIVDKLENIEHSLVGGDVRELLDLVERSVGAIKTSEYMKSEHYKKKDRTGKNSPMFNQDVDTEELIRRYKENGYKITNEMRDEYQRKYNIKYHGMMVRLKNAGVWKGREK